MCEFMTKEHLVLWSIVISCSILIITASLVPQRPPWWLSFYFGRSLFGPDGLNQAVFLFIGAAAAGALGANTIGVELSSSQIVCILVFSILLVLKALVSSQRDRDFTEYVWFRAGMIEPIRGVRHVDVETVFHIVSGMWAVILILEILNVWIYKTIRFSEPLAIIAGGVCVISIIMSFLAFRGWKKISAAARAAMEFAPSG